MNVRHLWKIYGRTFVIALLILYLPQTWIFWYAVKWPSDYHGMWLAMFPVMPGGFIAAVIRTLYSNQFQSHPPDFVLLLVAILFTVLLIAILTIIGARGKGWQIAAIILGAAYGIVAAMGLHAGFRM